MLRDAGDCEFQNYKQYEKDCNPVLDENFLFFNLFF